MTKVSWSLGMTMNIGNFQSVRIDCSVEDTAREGENVKQASDRVYQFVETELTAKVEEVRAELNGNS